VVRDPEIAVELVEARPFYISGDVAKPGSYPYISGLTVRRAVAIAGGLEVFGGRVANPAEAAELRGERLARLAELAQEEARLARLRAELSGSATPDFSALRRAPVTEAAKSSLIESENLLIELRRSDLAKEKSHLERVLAQAKTRLAKLSEQLQQEEAVVKQRADELARMRTLSDRGVATIARVSDEQQILALSRSRAAETAGRVAEAEREIETISEQIRKLESDRRSALTREIQERVAEVEKHRFRIATIGEQLEYVGRLSSSATAGGRQQQIVVYRRAVGQETTRLPADLDTPLLAGDLVEVAISGDWP
jgi:polysaccharide export outer membrane protein